MKFKNKLITIISIILIISGNFTGISLAENYTDGSFSDVPIGHWAYQEVKLMSDYGIINGYPDGTFKPDETVTRAQFAKMMVLKG